MSETKYFLHTCTTNGCYFYCEDAKGDMTLMAQNAGGALLMHAMTEEQCVKAVDVVLSKAANVVRVYTIIEGTDVLTARQKRLLNL